MALSRRSNNNTSIIPYAAAAAPLLAKGARKVVEYLPAVLSTAGQVQKISKKTRKLLGRYNEGFTLTAGRGDVSLPVAISKRVASMKPKFTSTKGTVHVVHRELVTTVNNSSGFSVNSGAAIPGQYRINPTNSKLFTWLPTMAAMFDSYTFTRMRFTYIPLCGSTETGRITLAWDKNSQDPLPSDKPAISAYSHWKASAPWTELDLVVPCDNLVRFNNDPNSADRKLVDLGQFLFGTYGGTSSNPIGDIYVEYGIKFTEAQPVGSLIQDAIIDTGGVLTFNGPEFVSPPDIVATNTSLTINLLSPGTFFITVAMNATTVSNVTVAGNGTNIGVFRGGTQTGTALFTGVFSSTGAQNATPTFTVNGVTGLTRTQFMLVKCTNATQFSS
jgi:hypothetical protein